MCAVCKRSIGESITVLYKIYVHIVEKRKGCHGPLFCFRWRAANKRRAAAALFHIETASPLALTDGRYCINMDERDRNTKRIHPDAAFQIISSQFNPIQCTARVVAVYKYYWGTAIRAEPIDCWAGSKLKNSFSLSLSFPPAAGNKAGLFTMSYRASSTLVPNNLNPLSLMGTECLTVVVSRKVRHGHVVVVVQLSKMFV